jgi:hypothetical protein
LPDEVDRTRGEMRDECVEVLGGHRTRVGLVGYVGIAESAEIHGVDAVARGKQRDEPTESPPGFRKPVDEEDGFSVTSRRDVMQGRVVHEDGFVTDAGDCRVIVGHDNQVVTPELGKGRGHPKRGRSGNGFVRPIVSDFRCS